MPTILMLTSTLPRFPGDSQANFVGEQAEAWAEARPDDRIIVLAPGDPSAPAHEVQGRVAIRRFNYMWPAGWQRLAYPAILPNIRRNRLLLLQVLPFLVAQYRAARRLVESERVDLVYAHWVIPQGITALLLKRSLGVGFVLQNHSSDLSVLAKLGRPGLRLARLLLAEARHFFCVNSAQGTAAAALLEEGHRAAFERKCTVLPMGIAPAPTVAGPEGEAFDIATIGRLSRKKGLDHLIMAAELLARRGIRPHIGIAGDGEEREMLAALVKDARITFTGFLSGMEKERFLAGSRRLAFPATAADGDVEGMPVALLEALARGCPVLASRDTNIEMLPEWADLKGSMVFVADPTDHEGLANALERLLAKEPQVDGSAARIVARYRWENLIEDYLRPLAARASRAVEV